MQRRQRVLKRTPGRLPPRAITIETEGYVRREAEKPLYMLARGGRTQRGHDEIDAELRQCYHIHITLHHERALLAPNRLAREV